MDDHRAGPDSETFPHFFNIYHVNADQATAVMKRLGGDFTRNKYNIGYWAWELEDFPDKWRTSFDCFREIWTPSTFCQDSISRKSPIPVIRMPHAVQVEAPALLDRAGFGIPSEPFTFLTVFDMLSVFERKNPLAVIEAYVKAFAGSPNCHLVVKINHADQRPTRLARLRSSGAAYPITFIDRTIGRDELNALIHCCDCLVSLHRSEGFGLPIAEAMYLGKPVIVTAYGGNMDFTNPASAFLVPFRLCSVGTGCEPYEEGQRWADPCVDEASAAMRTVYAERDLRESKAYAGQQFVRARLSPEAVGRLMKERLESLWSRLSQGTAARASVATTLPHST
jgi:glycosyltransferase involved in cell wall biosynthesis